MPCGTEAYLFRLYKHIEGSPVKANMADDVSKYAWSSYQHNALGETDKLITEHGLYSELSISPE